MCWLLGRSVNRGNCQTQKEYCEDHIRSGKSGLNTLADLYGIRPEDSIEDKVCQNGVNSQSKVKYGKIGSCLTTVVPVGVFNM